MSVFPRRELVLSAWSLGLRCTETLKEVGVSAIGLRELLFDKSELGLQLCISYEKAASLVHHEGLWMVQSVVVD